MYIQYIVFKDTEDDQEMSYIDNAEERLIYRYKM